MLDSLEFSPALVRTALWDVVAWNNAATITLTDYAKLAPEERNILKLLFGKSPARAHMIHWERDARSAVAAFRSEAARAGNTEMVQALVAEISSLSPEFAAIWRDYAVQNYGEGLKHIRHATAGDLALEYSSFAIDGRPDLGLVIFNPATADDKERLQALIASRRAAK